MFRILNHGFWNCTAIPSCNYGSMKCIEPRLKNDRARSKENVEDSRSRSRGSTWQAVLTNPQWRLGWNGDWQWAPVVRMGVFLQWNLCQRTYVEAGWEPSRGLRGWLASREPFVATWSQFFSQQHSQPAFHSSRRTQHDCVSHVKILR